MFLIFTYDNNELSYIIEVLNKIKEPKKINISADTQWITEQAYVNTDQGSDITTTANENPKQRIQDWHSKTTHAKYDMPNRVKQTIRQCDWQLTIGYPRAVKKKKGTETFTTLRR